MKPYCQVLEGPQPPPPRWTRREVIKVAFVCGMGVGAIVALIIRAGFGEWQVRNHDRLQAEAMATVKNELLVSNLALADAIRMSGGTESVDDVLRIKREWLERQAYPREFTKKVMEGGR